MYSNKWQCHWKINYQRPSLFLESLLNLVYQLFPLSIKILEGLNKVNYITYPRSALQLKYYYSSQHNRQNQMYFELFVFQSSFIWFQFYSLSLCLISSYYSFVVHLSLTINFIDFNFILIFMLILILILIWTLSLFDFCDSLVCVSHLPGQIQMNSS